MNIAYDGNAVYITLESIYREHVRGLCGSFDYNQDNDLRLPNGKLICDTNIFSEAYRLNETKPSSTSEEDITKKFDRPKAVRTLKRKRNFLFFLYKLGKILSWYQK
jgi:hypothetical protein